MHYDRAFFDLQLTPSLCSARAVLPHILDLIRPTSMLDVGCGIGAWLKAANELGVADTIGIDGDYVDRSLLAISKAQFRPFDLSKPFDLGRRFDMAISLEVAEHLPPSSAESFVQSLVNAAPVVLMSAAIPGQGGVNHLNERWQDYWAGLFQTRGYDFFDAVRPLIWTCADVQPYYAQNMLLYVERSRLADFLKLYQLPPNSSAMPLRVVHPKAYVGLWNITHTDNVPVRRAANQLAHSLSRAVLRRLGKPQKSTMIKA